MSKGLDRCLRLKEKEETAVLSCLRLAEYNKIVLFIFTSVSEWEDRYYLIIKSTLHMIFVLFHVVAF